MSNEDKCNKIKECVGNIDILEILKVDNINHKPHPYCITEKHLTGNDMYLNGNVIRRLEKERKASCGMYTSPDGIKIHNAYKEGWHKCTVPYDEHTSDTVCFLQLKREVTNDEISKLLKQVVDTLGETFISGFTLVETEQKYRII